ncbi:MAG TPA: VIT domain-containing protein, partial [Kofleriaceae bacterium]|nr:VIT domain-containing protein [Kofleriaceae bacterium]
MGLYVSGTTAPLAMLDSRIEITVRGPIIETVVVQRFRNTADHATEATYIFPVPADAAVSGMAMRIGTRTIKAAIESREAAQRRYEAAVTAGAAAALLDQERPDVFTQTVSAIPAKGTVEVTLRYDALARYEAGAWELVVPMVVAPRYVPGTASGRATTGSGRSPDTDRAPDASRVTPAASPGAGGSTAVAIHFVDEPSEVTSPTHELGDLGAARRDVALSDPHSDHDAIVRWRAPAASAGWVERDGEGGFAAVVVEAAAPPPRTAPVRVILAIDRAATTRGDGDAVEHPVVRALLGALGKADRVRVIGSDAIGWNAPDDVRAAIDRAWATPAGAFDLTRVLEGARPEGAAILLLSDGLVADDPAAIAAARRLGVPVHVVGIGPAPARATLARLAAATGGTVRYAVAGDDLNQLARAVAADLASPPAPLTINWGTLAAGDVEPAVLPRLGAGQALIVLARVKRV